MQLTVEAQLLLSLTNSLGKKNIVLFDDILVKPDVRYQGDHIIGFLHDEPTKAARTVLAIMIAPILGAPAFFCRLIPAYSLKHNLILK